MAEIIASETNAQGATPIRMHQFIDLIIAEWHSEESAPFFWREPQVDEQPRQNEL